MSVMSLLAAAGIGIDTTVVGGVEVPLSALLAWGPLWLWIDATWFTVKMSGPDWVPLFALFDHSSLLKRHLAVKVPLSMSVQTAAERVKNAKIKQKGERKRGIKKHKDRKMHKEENGKGSSAVFQARRE